MPSNLSKQLKTALKKRRDNPNALPYKCTRLYRDVKASKASLVAVASYVRDKARYKGACTESKERIADMLDLSRATVYRNLNALDKSDIKRDRHKLIPIKFEGKKYDKYPEFLNGYIFTFTIKRKGKNVTLTRALKATEKKIYGIIYAWLNSPKNTAGFYLTSISMLANISGYASSTVVEALHVLLRCGLIYRTADNKGTSRAHMSAYRLGTSTLRKISKELDVQTRQGERKEQPGESEKYYSELRAQAEIIADKNQEICKADSEFEELDRKSIDLSMKYAFAEVNAQQPGASDEAKDRARRLERELEEVNERRRERLHVLGFEEEDLRPRYNCDKCDDTGYDKRGRPCDCSPWRSKCKWKKPNILYLLHQ